MAGKPGRPKKPVTTPVEQQTNGDSLNYKTLYEQALVTIQNQNTQLEEYKKVCESYAREKQQLNQQYQQLHLEHKAKTEYMLDCAKHAYLSMQLALK